MTRRDKCYLVGKRASMLPPTQAVKAWSYLGVQLERMGDMDMPKFKHLLKAIREATITARRKL